MTTKETSPATATDTTRRPLNTRQFAFCRNYVANGGNASEAYRDAGYAVKNADVAASRLLVNVGVQAQIAEMRSDIEIAATVDRAYVVKKLRDFAENGEKENNRLRATELLGKTLRMFVDVNVASDGNADIPEELKKYSLEELLDLRYLMVGGGSTTVSDSEPVETTAKMIESGDGVTA
jgi:hypothetical protein